MAALDELTVAIVNGLPTETGELASRIEVALDHIFGERYRQTSQRARRVVLMAGDQNVQFAGLLHPENPSSGAYGGMSLIWFPIAADDAGPAGSLLTFVCGTRGLSPDEGIMGRHGHSRHLRALGRYLHREVGIPVWTKRDPTNLSQDVPDVVKAQFPRFSSVFSRYGQCLYAIAEVPQDLKIARQVVAAFLDFYAWERGWSALKGSTDEVTQLKRSIHCHLFPKITKQDLVQLLRERRFVILQGPPGTGKTLMADTILQQEFGGHGQTVQFHPAVTYETFVAGISPDVRDTALRFRMKPGWLVDAVALAKNRECLLVIDEINRADLGRVLGEAIYLFEPKEIAEGHGRVVRLPQQLDDGIESLSIPENLFVLGTMNSADRSIAILDLAVRRRFAFVDVWPDLDVVRQQGIEFATDAFGKLQNIFAQFAPDDALVLLPGHAYFLAKDEAQLARRLRFELIPLLTEYLQEGRLGPCATELDAYIDWLHGAIEDNGKA
jgi:5-methylcytosine-specific restriction protein B